MDGVLKELLLVGVVGEWMRRGDGTGRDGDAAICFPIVVSWKFHLRGGREVRFIKLGGGDKNQLLGLPCPAAAVAQARLKF